MSKFTLLPPNAAADEIRARLSELQQIDLYQTEEETAAREILGNLLARSVETRDRMLIVDVIKADNSGTSINELLECPGAHEAMQVWINEEVQAESIDELREFFESQGLHDMVDKFVKERAEGVENNDVKIIGGAEAGELAIRVRHEEKYGSQKSL